MFVNYKGRRLRQFSLIIGLFLITSLEGLFAQTGIKLPPPPRTVDLFEEELFGLEKYAIDSTFFAKKPGNYKRSVTLDSTGNFISIQETLDDVEFYFPAVIDLDSYVEKQLEYRKRQQFKRYFSESIANLKEEEFGAIELDIPIRIKNETFTRIFGSDRISLRVTGNISFDLSGRSEERSGAAANAQENRNDFSPRFSQTQQFTVEGKIGEKVTVSVQQNSEAVTDIENTLKLRYDGDEDEIVESIEAGNVSLNLPSTKYVIFGGSNQGLFGLKANMRVGNLFMTTIASLEKGQQEELKISGSASSSTTRVKDINYIQDRYFFIDEYYRDRWSQAYSEDLTQYIFESGTEILDLEVYVSTDPGNENAVEGAAVLNPADHINDPDYTAIPDVAGQSESTSFRFLEEGQYQYDPYRGFFWVNQSIANNQLLAVAYRTANSTVVGTFGSAGDTSSTVLLKMIKPRLQTADETYEKTWKLAMQNVYSLGGSNIDAEDFDIDIEHVVKGVQTQGDKTFLNLLGLDILDASSQLNPDEKVDLNDYFIDRTSGTLIFPALEPFNPAADSRFNGLADDNRVDVYYGDNATNVNQRQRESKFEIVIQSKSTKSTFDLGFYVLEGSDVVNLNGRTLVRDKDYVIDYFSGQLTLTSPEAKRSSADLEIKYERANLFQLDKKTILGGRAEYRFLDNSFIGMTALYMNKTTVDRRVRVGQEPFQNFVWDVNAAFKFKPRFLTTAVDALPLIETSDDSEFDIEGEFAQVLPDPNTLNSSSTGDNDGVAYIDDFEASKRATTLGIRYRTWTKASAPEKLPGLVGEIDEYDIKLDRTRAHLTWFNPYNQIFIQDIWPLRDVNSQTGRKTDALGLEFYRDPDTPVDSAWAGIMRSTASFADQQNTKYIELWVKGETGTINIDIGTISEDWYVKGNTFKGTPSRRNLNTEDKDGLRVLDDGEDVGIDGLSDSQESGDGPDPASDNWREPQGGYRNDGIFDGVDYRGINGTEGNSRARGSSYPDTEDLDGDGQLNTINKYYTYSFSLDPNDNLNTDWQSGSTNYKDGTPTGWRQFRIPFTEPTDSVGDPNQTLFEQIINVRLRLSNIENTEPQRLLIATFDFVGNEWQEEGYKTDFDTLEFVKDDKIFAITTYNTEENAVALDDGPDRYDSPPGVEGVRDRITNAKSKEQSLVMQLNDLPAGAVAEARKTLYSKMELLNYRRMKMFLYGSMKSDPFLPDSPQADTSNIEFYLRFGSDQNNYYEYGQRVYQGWNKYNKIDIDLDALASLEGTKNERRNLNNAQGSYFYATGNTVSMQLIRYFVIGVRNKNNREFSGELWLDEFRLSEVRGEKASALRLKTNLKIADVLRFTAEWESKDADFHNISTQFGEGNTLERQSYSGLFNFHKLLPASWEIKIPIDGRASYTRNIPKYLPRSDDLSGYQNDTFTKKVKSLFGLRKLPEELETEVSQSETIGFGTTITKSGKSKHWLPRYTIDNFTIDLDYSRQNRSQWDTKYNRSVQYKERYGFKIPFSNDNFFQPFTFVETVPVLGVIHDTKMYYSPSAINLNLGVSDASTQRLRRDSTASVVKTRNTGTTRSVSSSYKLFQNMTFSYSRNYRTDAAFDSLSRSQLYKNIFSKLDFGKQTDVDQKFDGKYNPDLFAWLTPDFSYNASFRYQLVSGYKYKQAINNVSKQIGLTFKPGDFLKTLFEPEAKKPKPRRGRSRRNRDDKKDDKDKEGEEKEGDEEDEEESSFPNPLIFVYDALSSWQQVKMSYNSNGSVSNQYLSDMPKWDYQFGFTRNPGVPQDTSLLSEGLVLQKPNIKKGYSLTTTTQFDITKNIKANLKHNFRTNLTLTNGGQSKNEDESWTYFAFGKDPKKDFKGISSDLMRFVPDWTVKVSNVHEYLFFDSFAKSISIDHGHTGKYDVKRKLDETGSKLVPSSESFTNNWSPLAAITIRTIWDVSGNVRVNNSTSYSYQSRGGATRTETSSFTISMSYSKSSGFSIPLPFWPFEGRTFKNEINFSLTYDQSENRSFTKQASSTSFKEQSKNTSWKLRPSATYKFNTRVQGSMFFETGATTNKITGEYSYSEFGISVNIAIRD